jgi:hypothetical protein
MERVGKEQVDRGREEGRKEGQKEGRREGRKEDRRKAHSERQDRQIVAIWTVKAGRRLNVVDWSCRLIKRVKKGLKLDTSPTSKAGEVVYVGLLLDWYGDIVVLPEVTLNFVFARSNTMCLWTVFAYKDLPKGIVAKYVLHPAVWRMLEGSLGRMLEDNPVATLEKA